MNPQENQLQYVFDNPPETGEVRELVSGVYWLRLTLPFVLNHINVWLIDEGDSYALVDGGIYCEDTIATWESILPRLDRPIKRLFATHCHPDHIGMASWFEQNHNTTLSTSSGEMLMAHFLSAKCDGGTKSLIDHFVRNGLAETLGEDGIERVLGRGEYYPRLVPSVPKSYTRLMDGDRVSIGQRTWQVIVGFGHSPEHLAFYNEDDGVLISGDMVLPRISTNISVWAFEPYGDPLTLFTQSLQRYLDLPADTLVLPSHGLVFRGLHTRIEQLIVHHDERLEECEAALDSPKSAADLIKVLFRRELDDHQFTFALGEALAHLHCLRTQGRAKVTDDGSGVIRFIRA